MDKNKVSLNIKKIIFNDGTQLRLNNDDIVIFVGANNVGKSQTIRDISNDLMCNNKEKIIIKDIEYNEIAFNGSNIKIFFKENNIEKDINGNYRFKSYNGDYYYGENEFQNNDIYKKNYYKLFYTYLETYNRLKMTDNIQINGQTDNTNDYIMDAIRENNVVINRINSYLFKQFKLGIDIAQERINGLKCDIYKVGNEKEINKTINDNRRDAEMLLKNLKNLNEQGDGIRSAVAILASLIASNNPILLIDEPETFLHPPQAKLLGANIVELSKEKQCFIATHSIDLIKGILSKNSTNRVKIIKINRKENTNEIYLLDNEDVNTIVDDKNLKHTNILDGLFYDCVAVCEDESDSKFYSLLLEHTNEEKYQKTLFCSFGGIGQFGKVAKLLKSLHIDYKIITDIDFTFNLDTICSVLKSIKYPINTIKEMQKHFITLYDKISEIDIINKKDLITQINDLIVDDKKISENDINKITRHLKRLEKHHKLKKNGIETVPSKDCKNYFYKLIDELKKCNIYVLNTGEIEAFDTSIILHGDDWVKEFFDKHTNLNDPIYNRPKEFIKIVFDIK